MVFRDRMRLRGRRAASLPTDMDSFMYIPPDMRRVL